jgi:mercuric ion binding protein
MKKVFLILIFSIFIQAQELKTLLHVEGMTCPLCTTAIKKSIKKIEGVKSVQVLLNTKKATVIADEHVTEEKLLEAIKKVGYSAIIESRQ